MTTSLLAFFRQCALVDMKNGGKCGQELPLAGVVLCFTSILPEQRTDMATIASQMGATHKFDLTSDVTHLLVGEINTPKYKFVARERADVAVLKPEWIEAVRQSWMQGEDTDIRTLEDQYRLPPLAGLSICITGFEDMAFRDYIQSMATANGAEFKKDLTKSVTHLIARSAEGQKYKFATQWNIKVVAGRWLNDSIERGMALEETLYHPLLPEEQQGAGAWNRKLPPAREKPQDSENVSNPRPRKLRRVASSKLGSQNEGIWGDIVGTGFDSFDTRPPKSEEQRKDLLAPPKPVIQETKSFASESSFSEALESNHQPSEPPPQARGFLSGCYFLIHGFSQKQKSVLSHHLSFNGGQLVESLDEFSSPVVPKTGNGLFIIVSHRTLRSVVPDTEDLAFECEVVTDMWLERCLDAKALVSPEAHVASTPVSKFPIPGFHGMTLCSTGFAGIDLLHLSKLVNLVGATYNEYLTPSASAMICNDPATVNSDKLRHTQEWGVPTVSADWLWISIQTGQKKPLDPHLVRKTLSRSNSKGPGKRSDSIAEQEHLNNSNGDTQPLTSREPEPARKQPVPQKSSKALKQGETVFGDGFAQERPPPEKASIPESKSPSPTRDESEHPADPSFTKPHEASATADPHSQSAAFNLAVSGLLKQAREANSRPPSDSNDKPDNPNAPKRKRKPLLGRAPSHSSTMGLPGPSISRASSIDTIHEEGCNSNATTSPEKNPPSRTTTSRSNQSHTSILNDGRFEFNDDDPFSRPRAAAAEEDAENQTPAMTQLEYEDPDAVAMREQFLSYAGKLVDKKKRKSSEQIGGAAARVGGIRELEDVGWGTGRRTRTRNAARVSDG